MARYQYILWFALIAVFVADPFDAKAQEPLSPFANPVTNRPIMNAFRQRATDNLAVDAFRRFSQNSPLSGKLCPKCAEKRNARFDELANDKELMKNAKEAALEKLQQEAKKAKFEAKALEEADFEKHKPWDVAAPENKESPSPLLQAAAASKEDQDLAPKKIRALEYLAQLGCSKDPKVEAAIIAGLQDHNPAVRWAAIQAVLASARGYAVSYENHPFVDNLVPQQPENSMIDPLEFGLEQECYPAKEPSQVGGVCEKEEPKEEEEEACQECDQCKRKKPCLLKRLKGLCKRCKGHGCNDCNYCGHEELCQECAVPMEPAPCVACDACVGVNPVPCLSCCPSKKILAELKRIAFDPDPDRSGCYYEPSLDVRNLALEALNVCPPLTEDDDDDNGGRVIEGEDTPEKRIRPTEEGTPDGLSPVPNADDNGNDTGRLQLDDTLSRNRVNSFMPISHRRTAPASELMMNARVSKFLPNGFIIEFKQDYLIPVGKQLLLETANGRHSLVKVIKSEVGFAQVVSIDGQILQSTSPNLYVGVVEDAQQ